MDESTPPEEATLWSEAVTGVITMLLQSMLATSPVKYGVDTNLLVVVGVDLSLVSTYS